MLNRLSLAGVLLAFIMFTGAMLAGEAVAGDQVPRMNADELLAQIDSSDVLIIDVRRGNDWTGSELMIKNAVRRSHSDVDSWAESLPKGKIIVLYCA